MFFLLSAPGLLLGLSERRTYVRRRGILSLSLNRVRLLSFDSQQLGTAIAAVAKEAQQNEREKFAAAAKVAADAVVRIVESVTQVSVESV